MNQGALANISGQKLEDYVSIILDNLKIKYIKQHKYTGIYSNQVRVDFYIPALDTIIECKNQDVAGSVCEKIPYVMECFEVHPAKNAILLFGGAFWDKKPGILEYAKLKATKSSKNIKILFRNELESYFEQTKNRSQT